MQQRCSGAAARWKLSGLFIQPALYFLKTAFQENFVYSFGRREEKRPIVAVHVNFKKGKRNQIIRACPTLTKRRMEGVFSYIVYIYIFYFNTFLLDWKTRSDLEPTISEQKEKMYT